MSAALLHPVCRRPVRQGVDRRPGCPAVTNPAAIARTLGAPAGGLLGSPQVDGRRGPSRSRSASAGGPKEVLVHGIGGSVATDPRRELRRWTTTDLRQEDLQSSSRIDPSPLPLLQFSRVNPRATATAEGIPHPLSGASPTRYPEADLVEGGATGSDVESGGNVLMSAGRAGRPGRRRRSVPALGRPGAARWRAALILKRRIRQRETRTNLKTGTSQKAAYSVHWCETRDLASHQAFPNRLIGDDWVAGRRVSPQSTHDIMIVVRMFVASPTTVPAKKVIQASRLPDLRSRSMSSL